jgi:hypothetical protein
MSEPTSPNGKATTLIASFDAARDAYLAAFAQAPDAALPYTPEGEEYALGVLPLHLQDSMNHYLEVYDRMAAANFAPVDLGADLEMVANAAELHERLLTTKPTGADRGALLNELNGTHQRVTERFADLDDAAVTSQSTVVYTPGTDPYPTSVADIFGWLTDHYNEHVAQTAQLLERWRAEQAS